MAKKVYYGCRFGFASRSRSEKPLRVSRVSWYSACRALPSTLIVSTLEGSLAPSDELAFERLGSLGGIAPDPRLPCQQRASGIDCRTGDRFRECHVGHSAEDHHAAANHSHPGDFLVHHQRTDA